MELASCLNTRTIYNILHSHTHTRTYTRTHACMHAHAHLHMHTQWQVTLAKDHPSLTASNHSSCDICHQQFCRSSSCMNIHEDGWYANFHPVSATWTGSGWTRPPKGRSRWSPVMMESSGCPSAISAATSRRSPSVCWVRTLMGMACRTQSVSCVVFAWMQSVSCVVSAWMQSTSGQ